MSKRNLLNLILLVFTIALVTIVMIEPGKDQAKKPPTLTTLKPADIHSIKIYRLGIDARQQVIELKKTAQGWQQIKPFNLPANSFRIDSILKLLSAPSLSNNDLSQLDLKKFGLARPLTTITFNDTKIEFGHNKSLKNHRYVKIGSTLYMIADTFYYQVNAKAESYIDHKLLPENAKITKLVLPALKLEQANGKWLTKPKNKNFSADAITQLINEWQLSQAFDLKVDMCQVEAKADITVSLADNKTLRFKIIRSTGNFILLNIDSGIRYILSKDRQDKLLKLSEVES